MNVVAYKIANTRRTLMMHSIRGRLTLMAISTAVLTTLLVVFLLYAGTPAKTLPASDMLSNVLLVWQQGDTTALRTLTGYKAQGYVVDSDGQILYNIGSTSCDIGTSITACFANTGTLHTEGRTVSYKGAQMIEAKQKIRDGNTIFVRFQPQISQNSWLIALILVISFICAMPTAFLLTLLTVRPIASRLRNIAKTSTIFASGNLEARTHEKKRDEIGQLGQQFDQMAAIISKQVVELRQLAVQHSELLLASEQSARITERVTLSRDLHDSISQHLFSLAMGTSSLASLIKRDPFCAATQAEHLAEIANQAQDDFRAVLTHLRPTLLTSTSTIEAIERLTQQWQVHNVLPVETRFSLKNAKLPLLIEEVLYRACQEGLNNIARHAKAQHVVLSLTQDAAHVYLTIQDDGCGFTPSTNQLSVGLGLVGIRERIRAVGGTLAIDHVYDTIGTRLCICVPLAPFPNEVHT